MATEASGHVLMLPSVYVGFARIRCLGLSSPQTVRNCSTLVSDQVRRPGRMTSHGVGSVLYDGTITDTAMDLVRSKRLDGQVLCTTPVVYCPLRRSRLVGT